MARPSTGDARDTTYQIREHRETLDRWRKVAKMAGLSLAEWIRALANKEMAARTKSSKRA